MSTERIRRFNRLQTRQLGLLDDDYLARGRPLGASRLLFEIGRSGRRDAGAVAVGDLRTRLGLDAGYLSRLVASLAEQGLVETAAHPDDQRRRTVRLSTAGEHEWEELDRVSDRHVERVREMLGPARSERLGELLDEARRLVAVTTVTFDATDPRGADAIGALTAYFAELDERFSDGFDPGGPIEADAAAYAPPHGGFVLVRCPDALDDGLRAIGCGAITTIGDGIGEIKRMWIHPDWRGLGLASRLLGDLESRLAASGHHTVRLDTNAVLTDAIAMYEGRGYHAIERYNDNPYAQRWFEKELGRRRR